MICKNCGNEMHNNEKFCPNCGRKCEESIDNSGYDETAVNNTITDDSISKEYADKKHGIFSKKRIISIAAILLVLLIAVVAFAGDAIKNFAYRTILSPSSYLKYVQEKNMDEVEDCIDEIGDVIDSFDFSDKAMGAEVGITLGNYAKSIIFQNVDSEVLPYIDWINDIGIEFFTKSGSSISGVEADLKVNGTHITNARFIADSSDGHMYISLPEISDSAIRFSPGYSDFEEEMKQIKNFAQIIPDENAVSDILCRYVGIITSQMKNVSRMKTTLTSDGISQNCTQLTVAIDGETALNIVRAVLTEAKGDMVLKNLICDVAEFYGEKPEEIIKSYDEEIAIALEDLATEEAPEFEEIPYIDIWVDNSADIIGGAFRYDPLEISISFADAGRKNAMSFSVKAPEVSFEINGSCENKAGKSNGKYIASFNGMNVIEIITENINIGKLDDGELEGRVILTVADEASGLLDMTGMDEDVQKLVSDGRIEIDSKDSKVNINLYIAEELTAGITLGRKEAKDIDLSLPAECVDEDESEEWSKTIRIDGVLGNLVKAGAPAELSLLGSFMTAQPTAEMAYGDMTGFSLE